jgi:hypothetical protein
MATKTKDLPSIAREFAHADLGDTRRTRRLQRVAERAEVNPDAGFPQMVASDAELEGVYRLLSNEEVTPEDVLAPHIEATLGRAKDARTCLIIHDTTEFKFGGEAPRDGLGLLAGNGLQQGFLAHVALAVIPDDVRTPLGVCAIERLRRFARTDESKYERQASAERESLRWERQIDLVEKRRLGRFSAIHVADREADIFDVLARLLSLDTRFVIRAHHDRVLSGVDEEARLFDRLSMLVPVASKTIELSPRSDRGRPLAQRKKHPARSARTATISVASCPLTLQKPYSAHATQDAIDVNLVRVWEQSPVAGEPPVEWILYTSERVDTAEQIFAVVDMYRCRWVIEEFFKALKTGCAFEKRQLESFHALSNALALFVPIAWKMLLARSLVRSERDAPATTLLTTVQLQLLQFRFELADPIATAKEAAYAVAKLGGHLRRNGLPGWQTLSRGFEALLLMQVGWRAALSASSTAPRAEICE